MSRNARFRLPVALTRLIVSTVLLSAGGGTWAQAASPTLVDFARQIYTSSAAIVHNERPQALLRAVVVLRIRLDAEGRFAAEVFRDNPNTPELTRVALESVARLAPPVGLSTEAEAQLRGNGLVEAWLFQTDGRFALKTLAKKQMGS